MNTKIITIQPDQRAWVDFKIRIKIDGKYYVGDLEMSE